MPHGYYPWRWRWSSVLVLAVLGAASGCSVFIPSEIERGLAVAHEDIDLVRAKVAAITTDERVLRNLDAIANTVSLMDALLNK